MGINTTSTNNPKPVLIIAISGPSSSGKTTITKNLVNLLNCKILHQDDFYVPDDQIPIDPITNEQNWDSPEAVDFEKFITFVEKVKRGEEFPEKIDTLEPDVDLKLSDTEIEDLKQSLRGKLEDYQIVLVDGFMLFHEDKLLELFDLKLFYYATHDCLKTRRSKRKGYSTVAGFWVDPPNYFDDYVWPAFEKYHKHLFENDDVNGQLNSHSINDLNIKAFKNDDSNSISEMVMWTIKQIIDYIN